MHQRATPLVSLTLALASGFLMPAAPASADETFTATAAITLPGGQHLGSFDISYVDPVIGLYALADRTNKAVDVADVGHNVIINQFGKGIFTGTAPCTPPAGANDCAGPNGVLIVDHRELWVGDGNSTVKVFDLAGSNTTPTHVISTGGTRRADELCAAEDDHVVLMANDADAPFPFISFISTQTYTVLKKIVFDGTNGTVKATNGIEQCQFDPRTNKFYLNIPEVNGPGDDSVPGAVVTLSPETLNIVDTFMIPLASCAGPQGMAIGPRPQILLGCNGGAAGGAGASAVINEHNGSVLATLANEAGADEVWFNPGDGHYFIARSGAKPNQLLGVIDARGDKEDASAVTGPAGAPNSHSVAADSESNHVFVPIGANHGTVCTQAGGNSVVGCIAVFTAPHEDRDDCVAQGSPVITASNGDDDAKTMKASCRDRDRD